MPQEKSISHDQEHPSYGMIGLSRFQCTPALSFFGSSNKHHTGVNLTIHKAVKTRQLSADRYYATQELISVYITEAQLGQLLASMNVGDGVPCTINHWLGRGMPACPEVHEREVIRQDFADAMKRVADLCETAENQSRNLLGSKSVTKAERAALLDTVTSLRQQVASNLSFVLDQFDESLSAMLVHAKADLQSYTRQLLESAGRTAISAELQQRAASMLEAPKESEVTS